ncbi:MAG: hypothetical protein AVDCRST_MAG01-01-1787 [uncultured Rubrobacteraceae bacterium]|uniref:Uncharacterized protein n=1 Tax=uncultured Rubrobacteraceae bacterium TaxID=349277 RepID=A0A6J4PEQ4_9ACTN|nr:MAG: hypothetical protein AVDCRST_MAG01-01-1787 [uncultured Rubrobacteraceae bacterium]
MVSVCPYSPECVEVIFSELRAEVVLGSPDGGATTRLARS